MVRCIIDQRLKQVNKQLDKLRKGAIMRTSQKCEKPQVSKQVIPEPVILNVGEIVDKLSILSRKIYFGEEVAISEHRYLEQQLTSSGLPGKLVTNVIRVTQCNIEIWNLEHEMRKIQEGTGKFTYEEIGRRAVKIRDLNRKRIEYKNLLNDIAGNQFRETKVNHLSGGVSVK